MRCNFRNHMQIEKAPANHENIFISLTADGANAHNTTKYILFVSICSMCSCQIDKCFLNLQGFFYFPCAETLRMAS